MTGLDDDQVADFRRCHEGFMDQRAEAIQRPVQVDDGTGGRTRTYTVVDVHVPCGLGILTEQPVKVDGDYAETPITTTARFPHNTDIAEGYRVIVDGDTWHVIGGPPPGHRHLARRVTLKLLEHAPAP